MIIKTHRNKDVSIRFTKSQYNDFMRHLEDCKDVDISLKILSDSIIDEENMK